MWYLGVLDCWFNEKHLLVAALVISYHCWYAVKIIIKWQVYMTANLLFTVENGFVVLGFVSCTDVTRQIRILSVESTWNQCKMFYHNLLYRLILLQQNISNVSFRCLSVTVKEIVNMRPLLICATALFLLAHVFIIALHCGFLPLTLQNSCVCTGSCVLCDAS